MLHHFMLLTVLFSFGCVAQENGRPVPDFPPLDQQCEDDAGPRWRDDLENFGQNKFYWSDSHARAVLNQDGTCPAPLEAGCQSRSNPLQAFIEGPIACPDAWFCRIYPDPKHGARTDFLGDRNFGDCDKSTWEATNTDQDGHCHGGLDPSSYYWWVRDHWNRPYAGRLKCCCVDSMEIPNTQGRRTMDLRGIANRCDYRAKVTVGADNCRDANEDHAGGRMGSGFLYGFDGPCPLAADGRTVAYTREPADEMCWEVLNFGLPDDNDKDDSIYPTSVGPCTGAGSATRGTCNASFTPGQLSGPNAGRYVRPDGQPVVTLPPHTPTFTYPPETTQTSGGNDGGSNGSTGGETDGETEEEPEEESEDDSQGDSDGESNSESDSSDVQVVVSSTDSCSAGRSIPDADSCRLAAESLGLEYQNGFSRADRPAGCYKRNDKVWFNRATQVVTESSDRFSLCCATDNCTGGETDQDDDDEEVDSGSQQFVQSSSGTCAEGTSYITEEDRCYDAAESLGLEVRLVFSNAQRVRGCYVRNGKAYFNRAQTFTATSADRKSICEVTSSSGRLLRL